MTSISTINCVLLKYNFMSYIYFSKKWTHGGPHTAILKEQFTMEISIYNFGERKKKEVYNM